MKKGMSCGGVAVIAVNMAQPPAARGESVTCVLLNNGVFGETGGHMTSTTVIGQRTKSSLEGRDASYHGHPILIGEMLAPLGGTAYAARGAVYDAKSVTRTTPS